MQDKPLEIEVAIDPEIFKRFQTLSLQRGLESIRSVPILEAKNLVKSYDDKVVIPGIDFSIPDIEGKAEIVTILGPSGCGKSTILKMIAGLEEPTSGDLFCAGKKVEGPGLERGMIFQKYSSFPFLNVLDNIAYPLIHVKKMKRKDAKDIAHHWVKKMYLEGAENKYPHQLSGGMQQRVAIARTLSMDAKIVLMDEPFGALDRKIRWEMQDLIAELAFFKPEQEFTILLVTHDIPEALYLGDRVWIINHGKIASEHFLSRPTESARLAQGRKEFLETVSYFNSEIDTLNIKSYEVKV